MVEQGIITEVMERDSKLFVTFKDSVSVFAEWLHEFSTGSLSKSKAESLVTELKRHELLSGFDVHTHNAGNMYSVHVNAPIAMKDLLPEDFVRGFYKETMQRRFASPCTVAELEGWLSEAIRLKHEFDDETEKVRESIASIFPDRKKAYHTRIFNELNRIFACNPENTEKLSEEISGNTYTKKLPQGVINLRKKMEAVHLQIKKVSDSHCSTEFHPEEGLRLILDSHKWIRPVRRMSAEEILNDKWMSVDIEIPFFKRENSEVSWVGLGYSDEKTSDAEIHTLATCGPGISSRAGFDSYKIIRYKCEDDLITGVKNSVLRENPFVITPYNARFDLLELGDAGDFSIGERDSDPVMEATTKYFERIGIRGRVVIDMLKWAQICLDYLPNQKLEMVARHLLGDEKFTKSINYDELEALEDIARSEDGRMFKTTIAGEEMNLSPCDASDIIGEYLDRDFSALLEIQETKDFKRYMKDAEEISAGLGIPIHLLFYSAKAVNLAQKWAYYDRTGIHRDVTYQRRKNRREEAQKARGGIRPVIKEAMMRATTTAAKAGTYKNVSKLYLRYGHALKDIITRTFEKGEVIFSKEAESPAQRFWLSRLGNAAAEYLLTDYIILLKKREKLKELLEKSHGREQDLELACKSIIQEMETKARREKKVQTMVRLTPEEIAKSMTAPAVNFYTRSKLDISEFYKLVKLKYEANKEEKRFGGGYRASVKEVKAALDAMAASVKRYLDSNNARIVHAEGPYLYVIKEEKAEDEAESIEAANNKTTGIDRKIEEKKIAKSAKNNNQRSLESIAADSISSVFVTRDYDEKMDGTLVLGKHRIYYKRHGYYHGIKLVSHATNRHSISEARMHKGFIDGMLEEDYGKARAALKAEIDAVAMENVENKELVWYTKSSDRHSAYENGEKIMFHTKRPLDIKDADVQKEEGTKREFVVEEIRGKQRKVYIMGIGDFEPDWAMYRKDARDIVRNLLHEYNPKDAAGMIRMLR